MEQMRAVIKDLQRAELVAAENRNRVRAGAREEHITHISPLAAAEPRSLDPAAKQSALARRQSGADQLRTTSQAFLKTQPRESDEDDEASLEEVEWKWPRRNWTYAPAWRQARMREKAAPDVLDHLDLILDSLVKVVGEYVARQGQLSYRPALRTPSYVARVAHADAHG
jgi:hypothetical protein